MIRAAACRRLAAAALISACLFPAATAASAQQLMPHMESCLEWGESDGQLEAVNNCTAPTTILFMVLAEGRVITQDVPPGGRFGSGAPEPVGPNTWMFTACPVGYVPSVRFSTDNADVILPSLYHCLRQGGPGA
jgi:hypothetical protein